MATQITARRPEKQASVKKTQKCRAQKMSLVRERKIRVTEARGIKKEQRHKAERNKNLKNEIQLELKMSGKEHFEMGKKREEMKRAE